MFYIYNTTLMHVLEYVCDFVCRYLSYRSNYLLDSFSHFSICFKELLVSVDVCLF